MPADRTIAEDLSRELIDLYARAEVRITADLARRLAAGMGQPRWAEDKLAATGQLRRALQRVLGELQRDTAGTVTDTLAEAYDRGGQSGLDELMRLGNVGHLGEPALRRALPGAETIQRLARSLAGRLEGTHLPVLRWALDSYRTVIGTVSPDIALGIATRRQAAQSAWEQLLDRGVTGFTDRAGRAWNLATYVEMATRTGVAQAAVEGHLDRLAGAGVDLVIVSNAPMECFRCRPWEGKVLSRGGPASARTVEVEHATRDGHMLKVKVAGSVSEAIAAGLMHPQCRHSLSAYLPGVTKAITNTEDPDGEAAREKLRDLERKVRRSKIKAAAAIDPDAVAKHQAKTRSLQGQIREHVAATEHLGVRRKPERERINLGHTNPPPRIAPAPTAPPKPPKPKTPTLAERVRTGVVEEKTQKLSGGKNAVTELVTYGDGSRGIRKTTRVIEGIKARPQQDAEELGAGTMRAFGLRAPETHRQSARVIHLELIEGRTGATLPRGQRSSIPEGYYDGDNARIIGLVDALTDNADRNPGNWMLTAEEHLTDDERLASIDFGLAYTWAGSHAPRWAPIGGTLNPFTRYLSADGLGNGWADNDLSPQDIASARTIMEGLRPKYESLGHLDWYENALTRLGHIGRHARGTRVRIRR